MMRRWYRLVLLLAVFGLQPALVSAQAQDTVIYYHTDAIGSVRMITDANGQVVARYDYLPFGEPWEPPSPNPDVRQFAGKERDTETGFNYFGARYYASGTGRFTTVDPVLDVESALTDPQGWNRYVYAGNNPLKYVDPDGRNKLLQWLANPQVQRMAMERAQRLYNWATGFFNSPTGQEVTQTVVETALGYQGSGPSVTGNVGKLAKAEFETGVRLAQKLGQSVRVSEHVGAEFVSAAGKTFDALGTPEAYRFWNQSQFLGSIDKHLLKSNNYTVIDLTRATRSQATTIRSHVYSLAKELQDRILFVGD